MVNPPSARNGRMPDLDAAALAMQTSVFRPLKAAESVARDIARDIVSRGLAAGESLPNEASMIEQYSVSRESLREGLRLLETQGLITIRRGPRGGPTVGSADPVNLGRVASLYFHMAGASYDELLDAWIIAETEITEHAARNPDADLRRALMQPYIDGHEPDVSEVGEFYGSHAGFHVKIGRLTENRVLELTLRMYGSIVSHHTVSVDDPRRLGAVIAADHQEIAIAVLAGHPRKARAAARRHTEAIVADIRAHLGERVHDYVEWL